MKNNDTFDNKLREKLHDFEPDFEERAWRNFAPNLQQASQVNRFARYKKYIAYAASVTLVLTAAAYMGYQNYRLSDTNKTLKEKNTVYQNLIEQQQKNKQSKLDSGQMQKDTESSAQAEKPNLTQEAESNSSYPYNENEKNESNSNKEEVALNKEKVAQNKAKSGEKSTVISPKKQAISPTNSFANVQGNDLANAPKPKHKKHEKAEKQQENASSSELVNVIITFKNRHNDSTSTSKTVENVTENVSTNSTEKKENKVAKSPEKALVAEKEEKKNATSFEIFSIENKTEKLNITAQSPKIDLRKPLDFPVEKPKMGFYVGGFGSVSKGIAGGGAMFSLAFHRNWSANIGVEFSRQMGRNFDDPDDFKEETGEDFDSIMPVPISSNVHFSQISYVKKTVSLPISLQYQHKIFSRFSAVASVGTRLLLDAKQHFSYRYKENSGGGDDDEHENNFQHRPPMPSRGQRFPLMVGLGLQANVNRWQFQATPYYVAHLEQSNLSPIHSQLDRINPFIFEFRVMRRF